MNNFRESILFTACICTVAFGCNGEPKIKPVHGHSVQTQKVVASVGGVIGSFKGRVRNLSGLGDSGTNVRATSSYRIEVELPNGLQPALAKGQSVPVFLPIIHHSEVRARVDRMAAGRVELVLEDQVQELSGQEVRAQIPLHSSGLYRVPFGSVYSPRGLVKRIFLLQGDRVRATPVEVVGPTSEEGDIWIAAQIAPDSQMVVSGLDNLVSGDQVHVVSREESLQ